MGSANENKAVATAMDKTFEVHNRLRLKCGKKTRLFCGQFTSIPTKPEGKDEGFQKNSPYNYQN